mmetsp:Transcript_41733/g.124819  ORF Transcript_41733/g.124819 Transcript_41733/m.124819 type:complete len:81 (-) Transcript_41733:952-1194(-)
MTPSVRSDTLRRFTRSTCTQHATHSTLDSAAAPLAVAHGYQCRTISATPKAAALLVRLANCLQCCNGASGAAAGTPNPKS